MYPESLLIYGFLWNELLLMKFLLSSSSHKEHKAVPLQYQVSHNEHKVVSVLINT